MKKIILASVLIAFASGFAFAQFELNAGLYGGYGTAGAAGLNIQAGYNFSFNDDKLNLALLADLGFGYRYGNKELEDYYKSKGWEDSIDANDNMLEYYIGAIGEFYFLSFMGIGAGGGFAKCTCGYALFRPYARVTLPFVFSFFKAGFSFDYLFLNEGHKEVPTSYRVNLFASVKIMDLVRQR